MRRQGRVLSCTQPQAVRTGSCRPPQWKEEYICARECGGQEARGGAWGGRGEAGGGGGCCRLVSLARAHPTSSPPPSSRVPQPHPRTRTHACGNGVACGLSLCVLCWSASGAAARGGVRTAGEETRREREGRGGAKSETGAPPALPPPPCASRARHPPHDRTRSPRFFSSSLSVLVYGKVGGRVRAGGGGCHATSTRAAAGPSKLGPRRGRPAEKLE